MKMSILKLLANAEMTVSMSQGRRYVAMGAVSLNGLSIADLTAEVEVQPGDEIKVGRCSKILTAKHLTAGE